MSDLASMKRFCVVPMEEWECDQIRLALEGVVVSEWRSRQAVFLQRVGVSL